MISPASSNRHWPEYATEIGVVLASLGLYAFFSLTGHVLDGETMGFDRRVLLMFRLDADLSDPVGPEWVETVVRDLSALGGLAALGLIVMACGGYLWLTRRPRLAAFLVFAAVGGSLANTLLKHLIDRARPDLVPHGSGAALSSFPSGHSMMAAVVYLTLGALLALSTTDARIKFYVLAWSVLLTVMVGVSRVYLGVHWPTDVIAGWIAGALWAMLCLAIAVRLPPEKPLPATVGDGATK